MSTVTMCHFAGSETPYCSVDWCLNQGVPAIQARNDLLQTTEYLGVDVILEVCPLKGGRIQQFRQIVPLKVALRKLDDSQPRLPLEAALNSLQHLQ